MEGNIVGTGDEINKQVLTQFFLIMVSARTLIKIGYSQKAVGK